ncbi:MAG: hypothetical protein PWQ82_1856 [Thermosediminibacterales bacterium]|nr:hypothetical protein [Thermosediminibacterales bacterium]
MSRWPKDSTKTFANAYKMFVNLKRIEEKQEEEKRRHKIFL